MEATQKVEPPQARELPGVIFYHYLDPNGGTNSFISYWESREDFEASRVPLEERLGAAKLHRAAWVRRLDVQKEPLWKRFTAYSVLLHVVAVLGALSALEKHYDWLLEAPRISLDLKENEPINLPQGAPLSTSLVLTNQRATVAADISALDARLVGLNRLYPILAGGSYSIRERDSMEIALRTQSLAPGRYQLEVEGQSRSGRLRGWKPFSLKRGIRVWHKAPRVELAFGPNHPSPSKVKALLHIGEDAPEGLDCQATLMGKASLRFGPIEFPGLTNWPDPDVSRDGSVSIQLWTTPPLRRFSVIPFFLYLDGQPVDGQVRPSQHIAVECSKRASKE